MTRRRWAGRSAGSAVRDATIEWEGAADEIALPRIDESSSEPRSPDVGTFYSEDEYGCLAAEQEQLWSAAGEEDAREHTVKARGLDVAADAALTLLRESETTLAAACADEQHATRVLLPHVQSQPGAKLRYWIVWPLLTLGEASGIWSAAISWGDVPSIAAGQALSAGLAGACAGLVGRELKHVQLAQSRRQRSEPLTPDEQRYEHLLTGSGTGLAVVKLMSVVSLFVAALLAVAVFALRTSVEGSSSGLTYGLIGFATAVASGLLGYQAADDVGDLLATYAKRVKQAERHHRRLAGHSAIRARAEADEAARSLQAEAALRGHAARKRLHALSFRILRRNPGVAGHGYANRDVSGVIGRRLRQDGGAK